MNVKNARLTLAIVGFISIIALILIPRVRFNYDFESFFPIDDPDLDRYMAYRDHFSLSDNDYILVGLEHSPSIFDQAFLEKVEGFADTLEQLPYVIKLQSPTRIKQFIVGPLGPIQAPYLHIKQPQRYTNDSTRIYSNPNLVGSFFSTDGTALTILIETEPGLGKKQSDTLATLIEDLVKDAPFEEVYVAGKATGQKYYVQKMQRELIFFSSISIVLVILFLWVTFRAAWGIVIPLLTVVLSIVWLIAFMVLTGKDLDVLSMLLPVILFVVGMSDVVHIISRYLEELRNGLEKEAAVRIAFRHVGMATLLTSVTTGIGFITLYTVNIKPVQDFGLYTAIGVLFALVLAFSILPSVLLLTPTPKLVEKPRAVEAWYRIMHPIFKSTISHSKWVLAITSVVVLLSFWGISQIKVNNYFLEDLSEDDPHRAQFEFFEEKFAGVRPFDLHIEVEGEVSVYDTAVLQQIDRVEQLVLDIYPMGFVSSPTAVVKSLQQSLNGGKQKAYRMPSGSREWKGIEKMFKKLKRRPEIREIISEDEQHTRLSAKVVDIGGSEFLRLNDVFYERLPNVIDTSQVKVHITGMSYLIDKNNAALSTNMLTGLLIAFAVIAAIMGALFKSPSMVLISLVPNILPLLVIGGFMGFAGIDLKISTAIIFTIAFGIAVDDTIHYMSKLRLELNKGKPLLYALKRASLSTGKAITITSLILLSGFIALSFSDFMSTHYIGLLVSMTLFLAVIGDLYLLPVLIRMFYRDPNKQKNN